MRCLIRTNVQGALTLIECVAVVGAFCLLALLVVVPNMGRKLPANRIHCVNNLKNIGLSFRTFAVDNDGSYYPWAQTNRNAVAGTQQLPPLEQASELWRYFAAYSNELSTPKILSCPSDTRRSLRNTWECVATNDHNGAISYAFGLDSAEEQPQSILSSDRNWTVDGLPVGMSILTLRTNHAVGFHTNMHNRAGNVLLGDGSVQQVTSGRLRDEVRDAIRVQTNGNSIRLVVP